MNVKLGQAIRKDRSSQVGVAAVVELFSHKHFMNIRVTARTKKVVAPTAVGINTVLNGVIRGRQHWPQIGVYRPQSVEGRHVGALELPRPRRPEVLARITQVPAVKVGDLGAFDHNDSAELTGSNRPCLSRTNRDHKLLRERPPFILLG